MVGDLLDQTDHLSKNIFFANQLKLILRSLYLSLKVFGAKIYFDDKSFNLNKYRIAEQNFAKNRHKRGQVDNSGQKEFFLFVRVVRLHLYPSFRT